MKMKKKILSAAVLAAIGSGAAHAINVSSDGTGEVILFPYYTVQGNEDTYLEVVNTTDMGKAVKIRFREAYNSREVLDFNIYLSPHDVWVGAVTRDPNGDGAAVRGFDNSCTVPNLDGRTIPFRRFAYTGNFNDDGPDGIERTKEGYVEIIEMGVIDTDNPDSVVDDNHDGRADFVHIDGVPENCQTLVNNWDPDNGHWATVNNNTGLEPPTGGLYGSLSIINTSTGTQVGVNATALDSVMTTVEHHGTGTDQPNWTSPGVSRISVVMTNRGGANGNAAEVYEDDWAPSGAGFQGVNAISAALMAQSVINSYSYNPDNFAESAWVVTFPTKWAYVSDTGADAPFTAAFDTEGACEEFLINDRYDREEKGPTPDDSDVDFSPQPPGVDPNKYYLCWETNVIQFGDDSKVFSSANTTTRLTGMPGSTGWLRMRFTDVHAMGNGGVSANANGNVYAGLPVIGFKAKVLGNAQFAGNGSYASAVDHVYDRVISGANDAPATTAWSQTSGL